MNNYESFLLIDIGIYNILPTWKIHLDISYFSLVFIVFLSFACSYIIYKIMCIQSVLFPAGIKKSPPKVSGDFFISYPASVRS